MRGEKSDPPALAIWLLRHLRPGRDSEALSGDLLETFAERRSRGWLWRQVLIAIAMGPHIGYAIAGTAAAALTGYGISPSPAVVRWRMLTWALPWPWPGVVFDSGLATLYVSVTLPILAALLLRKGMFAWASLLRVFAIGLPLILVGDLATAMWVDHLSHGHPSTMLAAFGISRFVVTFFVAASWGCQDRGRSRRAT